MVGVVKSCECWLQAGRNSQGIINAVAGFSGAGGVLVHETESP